MSRSIRHTPKHGNSTCASDKAWKVEANRVLRRKTRWMLSTSEGEVLPLLREVSDVWSFGKDGKTYRRRPWDGAMRK